MYYYQLKYEKAMIISDELICIACTSIGGAWLIAYNIAQQNRFKAIISTENIDENDESDKKLTKNHGDRIKSPIDTPDIKSSPPKILDGFFLVLLYLNFHFSYLCISFKYSNRLSSTFILF